MRRSSRRHGVGTGGSSEPRSGEIYFEFRRVGNAVKVTAVDADSGVEVVVMGPATASQTELQNLAHRKLEARLERDKRQR